MRLECPQDSTNRSRPGQWVSAGLCRITFWNSRYATGARLIAVPGWPLPTFCTASAASTRMVSMARASRSVQPSGTTAWSAVWVSVTALRSFHETSEAPGSAGRFEPIGVRPRCVQGLAVNHVGVRMQRC